MEDTIPPNMPMFGSTIGLLTTPSDKSTAKYNGVFTIGPFEIFPPFELGENFEYVQCAEKSLTLLSDFKPKIHQVRFQLWLQHRPRWRSLQHSPDFLDGFWGVEMYPWRRILRHRNPRMRTKVRTLGGYSLPYCFKGK